MELLRLPSNATICRIVDQADFPSVEALLDGAFQVPEGQHYFDDFPIWNFAQFQNENTHLYGVRVEGHGVIAVGGLTLSQTRIDGSTIGVIGAVATHPDFKKAGIATRLLETLIQKARADQAHLVMLWGMPQALYSRLGFIPFGIQERTPLRWIFENSPASTIELKTGYHPQIGEMMLNSKAEHRGFIRRAQDLTYISKQNSTQWLWTLEAYLGLGRGIDLGNMVHELGGSKDGMRKLLNEAFKRYPLAELLSYPGFIESIGLSIPSKQVPVQEWLAQGLPLTQHGSALMADRTIWCWGLDSA